ncbi:MAG: hypothetical protein IKT40_07375 [Bacilli bacterium]|nr:hypothetical protein [Bacilli bacterium]
MSKLLNAYNEFKGAFNSITKDIEEIRGLCGLTSISKEILAKPIGIIRKNHRFIEATLHRNIGNDSYSYDGIGTPISDIANPYMNSEKSPWFELDSIKSGYKNYLDYVNDRYFSGLMTQLRFPNKTEDLRLSDTIASLDELNSVGVIRGYDYRDNALSYLMLADGTTSPNGHSDTRLGVVNNFYLTTTLQRANNFNERAKLGSLTDGAYSNFDIDGAFGMKVGFASMPKGKVLSNESLNGGALSNLLSNGWNEELFKNSNELTQQMILKSLTHKDLLLNDNVKDVNEEWEYIKKEHRDKISNAKSPNNPHKLSQGKGFLSVYQEAIESEATYNGNSGINYGNNRTFVIDNNENDIVKYTNDRFKTQEYKTIIGRFHTTDQVDYDDITSTAVSKHGMSRGRNLLKKNGKVTKSGVYDDPYCRVWTYHKQYNGLNSLIRPFSRKGGAESDYRELSRNLKDSYQINRDRLDDFSKKHYNGLVQIAPTQKNDITKCMFSLENLAWKNEKSLTNGYSDQIGPCGGRIMWFPPYDLSFNENVDVNWNSTNFIGRGEPIYTYTNTNRSGNLKFKLLIDHPSLLNNYRNDKTNEGNQGVDDVNSTEQTLLRFFAGCEVLEGKERKPSKQDPLKPSPIKEVKLEPLIEPIMQRNVIDKQIVFYVFFPNNYSGVDDNVTSAVRPMEYLINGFGASIGTDSNGKVQQLATSLLKNNKVCGGYEISEKGLNECFENEEVIKLIKDNDGLDLVRNKQLSKVGKPIEWGYRVDNRVKNEALTYSNNYDDRTSFQLNGKGYKKLLSYHTDANKYQEEYSLFSFADVFAALEPSSKNLLNSKDLIDNVNVDIIKKLIDEYDIVSVETKGFASSHGSSKSNDELSSDRANSVFKWLEKTNSKFTKDKHFNLDVQVGEHLPSKDVSSIEAKIWRCTKVVISLSKEEIKKIDNQKTLSEGQINYFNRLLTKYANDENAKLLIESGVKVDADTYNRLTSAQKEALISLLRKSYSDANFKKDEAVISGNVEQEIGDTKDPGYGREYEFFSEITNNNTLLHNRLKDKIKYFDPAFHSVSPEGFNARLNFLHQCTRQGSTSSSSDLNSESRTSNNLSFGAPPICVLRLGDFYNTKILITNMGISFDETTWDLNDEGIGVMPMIADISLSFNFLGGSELYSPIARLQNAVSFNYYANTSVYDDRADKLSYETESDELKQIRNKFNVGKIQPIQMNTESKLDLPTSINRKF